MKIALLGTVGVPGLYGGFETLAENLVRYHAATKPNYKLTVWCSAKDKVDRPARFESADLRYVRLKANGVQSVFYDAISMIDAIWSGHDRIILLGVSGALMLPVVRLFSRVRIVTNIDGIEWKRDKWTRLARAFLRASEWAAVRYSHDVIADNEAIADHVRNTYGRDCSVIAYGGDHAIAVSGDVSAPKGLPDQFALGLCRIEPENNVQMILEAWVRSSSPLVFVGNWAYNAYGQELREEYADCANLFLLDPIYDQRALYALRSRTTMYLHGHSAGGTNPALVEMMHFGVPILAYGCSFNRSTTEGKACYFNSAKDLICKVDSMTSSDAKRNGAAMLEVAQRRYTWDEIAQEYFALMEHL